MTPEQRQAIAIAQARARMGSEGSREVMEAAMTPPKQQERAALPEHVFNGVNTGISGLLGFPVDAMETTLNAVIARPKFETETDEDGLQRITGVQPAKPIFENSLGGSASIENALRSSGAITDAVPETAAERYLHSIGEAAGGMIVPGLGALSRARQVGRVAGLEVGSAVGEGVGSQAAEDVFPDSPIAQVAGALLGGGTPIGLHRLARQAPQAPSIAEKFDEASRAYERVDAAKDTINPHSRQRLIDALRSRMSEEGIDSELHPRASRSLDLMDERLPASPRIADIEQRRRGIGRNVAGSIDREEARLGTVMKDEIDTYLNNLSPSDMSGGNPQAVLDDLRAGRDATARGHRASLIEDAAMRGERRAATSGTGGNAVNTIRQNIRSILDNPRKRRGFTPDEIQAMEDVVRGTPTTNALRQIGRLSPSSGTLPMAGGLTSAATMGPIGLTIPAAGYLGKYGAETLTDRQIKRISDLILNGAPLDTKRMSDVERRVVTALLASNAPEPTSE